RQQPRAGDAERGEHGERDHPALHGATPVSLRDTRSPGASPDLISIIVAVRRPSSSRTRSNPPPVRRYATGPSGVANTASAGTTTALGTRSVSIWPRNRIPGRSGSRVASIAIESLTTLLGSVGDLAWTP